MLSEVFASPALHAFEAEGLLVMVSLQSPDNATYRTIVELHEAAVSRHGRVSVLVVIPRFDGPLRADRKTQEDAGARMRLLADKILGSVTAVTVPGLKGTFLRMMLTTIDLLNGTNAHIVGSIPEAVDWVQQLADQRVSIRTAPNLVRTIEVVVAKAAAARDPAA